MVAPPDDYIRVVGDVFFSEQVILNPDGSPMTYIGRFTSRQSDVYPYRLYFTVTFAIAHRDALNHLISFRIKDGDTVIHESGEGWYHSDKPQRPVKIGFNCTLQEVEIPKPGKYTVEILVNDVVKHREPITFL